VEYSNDPPNANYQGRRTQHADNGKREWILVVVNARVELALVVEFGGDLPASEFPSFVEAVDSVESTKHGLEVDVDYAVLVALV
jgi:hypothetical protein